MQCTWALLAALGSCLAVGIHANAMAQNITIRSLELEVEADIDTTAIWGADNLSPKTISFESIRVSVRLDADASRAPLEALILNPFSRDLSNPGQC